MQTLGFAAQDGGVPIDPEIAPLGRWLAGKVAQDEFGADPGGIAGGQGDRPRLGLGSGGGRVDQFGAVRSEWRDKVAELAKCRILEAKRIIRPIRTGPGCAVPGG